MLTINKDYPTLKPDWFWIITNDTFNHSQYVGCRCWELSNSGNKGCSKKVVSHGLYVVSTIDGADINCVDCAAKNGHGEPPMELITAPFEPEVIKPMDTENQPKKIISFGYKFGELDEYGIRVIDVRKKVRNPWKDKALRKLVGYDPRIKEFISRCGGAQMLLNYWSTALSAEGSYSWKSGVAFACHGGKHRSVAMAELLAERLIASGQKVEVIHRDVQKVK